MEIVAPNLKPKTIFFGGGTPSLLNLRQWEIILRAMEKLNLPGALNVKQNGREVEILANGNSAEILEKLKALSPEDLKIESLSLEEIFVASGILKKANA